MRDPPALQAMSEVNAPLIGHPGMSIPHGMDLSGLSGEVSVAHAGFQDSWPDFGVGSRGLSGGVWRRTKRCSEHLDCSEIIATVSPASHASFESPNPPPLHFWHFSDLAGRVVPPLATGLRFLESSC